MIYTRTLDSEVYEYFQNLPDDILKKLCNWNILRFMDYDEQMEFTNKKEFCDSKFLKNLSNKFSERYGILGFDGFDDSKALINPDNFEELAKEWKSSRKIPGYELTVLAKDVWLLRKRKTKKGISLSGKKEEIQQVKNRTTLKQLVESLSDQEFKEKKKQYDEFIKNGERIKYFDHETEQNITLKMLFGEDIFESDYRIRNMPLIYIEQAFEEREKEKGSFKDSLIVTVDKKTKIGNTQNGENVRKKEGKGR